MLLRSINSSPKPWFALFLAGVGIGVAAYNFNIGFKNLGKTVGSRLNPGFTSLTDYTVTEGSGHWSPFIRISEYVKAVGAPLQPSTFKYDEELIDVRFDVLNVPSLPAQNFPDLLTRQQFEDLSRGPSEILSEGPRFPYISHLMLENKTLRFGGSIRVYRYDKHLFFIPPFTSKTYQIPKAKTQSLEQVALIGLFFLIGALTIGALGASAPQSPALFMPVGMAIACLAELLTIAVFKRAAIGSTLALISVFCLYLIKSQRIDTGRVARSAIPYGLFLLAASAIFSTFNFSVLIGDSWEYVLMGQRLVEPGIHARAADNAFFLKSLGIFLPLALSFAHSFGIPYFFALTPLFFVNAIALTASLLWTRTAGTSLIHKTLPWIAALIVASTPFLGWLFIWVMPHVFAAVYLMIYVHCLEMDRRGDKLGYLIVGAIAISAFALCRLETIALLLVVLACSLRQTTLKTWLWRVAIPCSFSLGWLYLIRRTVDHSYVGHDEVVLGTVQVVSAKNLVNLLEMTGAFVAGTLALFLLRKPALSKLTRHASVLACAALIIPLARFLRKSPEKIELSLSNLVWGGCDGWIPTWGMTWNLIGVGLLAAIALPRLRSTSLAIFTASFLFILNLNGMSPWVWSSCTASNNRMYSHLLLLGIYGIFMGALASGSSERAQLPE